jgi:hypothetical protein
MTLKQIQVVTSALAVLTLAIAVGPDVNRMLRHYLNYFCDVMVPAVAMTIVHNPTATMLVVMPGFLFALCVKHAKNFRRFY